MMTPSPASAASTGSPASISRRALGPRIDAGDEFAEHGRLAQSLGGTRRAGAWQDQRGEREEERTEGVHFGKKYGNGM